MVDLEAEVSAEAALLVDGNKEITLEFKLPRNRIGYCHLLIKQLMNKLLILFSFLFLFNCDNLKTEDCSTVLCVADFSVLYLELIEVNTNDNILANESYSIADIKIQDDSSVTLAIDSTSFEVTTLRLRNDEWTVGMYEYTLLIGDDFEIPIEIDLALSGGQGCCSNILVAERLNINNMNISQPNSILFRVQLEE